MMVVAVAMLTACEVIPEDERDFEVFIPRDTTTNDSTQTLPVTVKRSSLLIEYSGWMCVNCPTAAEVAHQLKEQYGEQLVVVVMHPESNPNTRHNNKPALNYTCPEADSIYIMMGGTSTTAFPTGNINLFKHDTKSYFTDYSMWGKYISQAYSNPKPVIINQEVKGTAESKDINIVVDITNLDITAIEATLQVWLTEDNVIGSQKKPEGTDKNYVHNHLMRASISPIWGEVLSIDAQMTEQVVYEYTLPDKVVKENCNIVAIVSVNGEVVQAKETRITIE
ncbi:MAG: Omp28 family outer membrane lipoprotein [Paludibacteraceae bacterium]|nr:Omp28 family outer membrane lipoprotein [Paludibacteraceae bacterium]